MTRRKNTNRIDPRYFLNETTHRDELDESMELTPKDLLKRIRLDKGEEWYKQNVMYPGVSTMQGLVAALTPEELEHYGLTDDAKRLGGGSSYVGKK